MVMEFVVERVPPENALGAMVRLREEINQWEKKEQPEVLSTALAIVGETFVALVTYNDTGLRAC
ncbi:MAG: hypothetical protein HY764_00965 [Candidatus Portnoybacteria bacterium]|nr:hypothetical protein [Candidatus Portnoybacteria bacterium]